MTFPQHLEEPVLSHIDQRNLVLGRFRLHVLGDERPKPVEVDDRAEELVAKLVEVSHTDFTEVTGMVLVEEDPVVVHSSGVTTTSGMLSVLSDTTMSGADVATLLPVLLESRRHFLLRLGFSEEAAYTYSDDLGFSYFIWACMLYGPNKD